MSMKKPLSMKLVKCLLPRKEWQTSSAWQNWWTRDSVCSLTRMLKMQFWSAHQIKEQKFDCSCDGLCFHDTTNWQVSFLNSQKENSENCTQQQLEQGKTARNLCQMMGHPSVADHKNAIKCNCMADCPVKLEDVEATENIFGRDIHALKGKTVHLTPF